MPKSKKLKVSIIISCYNHGKYLKFCINSILSQTFKDFEIILINDGSTDDTVQIAKSFKDKRLRFFNHKKNIGAIKRTNEGLKRATGGYINLFSADDGMLPKNLEKKARILEKSPEVGFVFSEMKVIDGDGKFIRDTNFRKSKSYVNKNDYYEFLSYGSFIHTASMLTKASCYKKIGFYDEEIPLGAEWYNQINLCKNYKSAYINEPLVFFRMHGENWSKWMDVKSQEMDLIKALNKHFGKNPCSKKLKKLVYGHTYYSLFKGNFSRHNFIKAVLFLTKSLQSSPSCFFSHLVKKLKNYF